MLAGSASYNQLFNEHREHFALWADDCENGLLLPLTCSFIILHREAQTLNCRTKKRNTFLTWEPTYFINGITVFLWLMVKLWCEVNQEVSVVFKDTFFAAGHIKALQLIFLKLHLLIFDHLGAVLSTVIDTALTYYHLLKVLFVRKSWFLTLIPTSSNTGPSMSLLTCWDETQRSTFLTNVTLI